MSSCCQNSCCCARTESPEVKEVQEVLNLWLKAVSSGSPDAVMTLYSDNAVFLPHESASVCDTPAKRLEYFKQFTAKDALQGQIDEIHTRVMGDVAINSGLYSFSFKKDGQPVSVVVRFTYVYKKTPLGWMIVEHHASLQPTGH